MDEVMDEVSEVIKGGEKLESGQCFLHPPCS